MVLWETAALVSGVVITSLRIQVLRSGYFFADNP